MKTLFNLHENTTSVESTVSKGANTLKKLLGNKTVESFSFRTCVKPILSQNEFGETEIVYESLTAQELLSNYIFSSYWWHLKRGNRCSARVTSAQINFGTNLWTSAPNVNFGTKFNWNVNFGTMEKDYVCRS